MGQNQREIFLIQDYQDINSTLNLMIIVKKEVEAKEKLVNLIFSSRQIYFNNPISRHLKEIKI